MEDEHTKDWLESGVVHLTGRADSSCLIPPGFAATRARFLAQHISVATAGTRHHVLVDGSRLLAERAAFTGRTRRGSTSVGGACRLIPACDGWVAVSSARPDDPALLRALMSQESDGDIWTQLSIWLQDHTVAEFDRRAEVLGIAGRHVATIDAGRPIPTPRSPRSVEGMLVVDFSALWAGPLCAHLLGLAGARVVKVETPTRPDGARLGNRDFYRLLHAGHESVVIDPSTTRGRAALAALVDAADIVVEASRPRALHSFGLDVDASVDRGCTWISITADGRRSNRVGFGDDVAASAGLVATDGDGLPVFVGDALADPLTGLTAAAMAMSEPPEGAGVLWDLSMTDIVAATLEGTPSRAWTGEGLPVEPTGRGVLGDAPATGADTDSVLSGLGIELP